jgi:hypothetical protein
MKTNRSALVAIAVLLFCAACALRTSAASEKKHEPYALIYGTVYGPDDRPVQGVHVRIRKKDDKKPKYEQYSDARGEFAQRLPVGPSDYIVYADLKGVKTEFKAGKEVSVHFDGDERQDISLHLTQ